MKKFTGFAFVECVFFLSLGNLIGCAMVGQRFGDCLLDIVSYCGTAFVLWVFYGKEIRD